MTQRVETDVLRDRPSEADPGRDGAHAGQPGEPVPAAAAPTAARMALAFGSIYFIWGSTYLAIRVAIETLPPFLMAAARFLIAGGLLYVWARRGAAARPSPAEWRAATIAGGLMLLGGNGGVVWAEQRVASGVTALLVASVPLWMVLVDWLRPSGRRPTASTMLGVLAGLGGVVLLVGPGELAGARRVDPLGAGVLMFASLCWSIGSVYARHGQRPGSAAMTTAMQMLAGGALLLIAGTVAGQWSAVHAATVSLRSLGALAYLIVLGSLVGYSAYVWLLGVTTPARVATYAYVNPVVAMVLGWLMANEPLTARTLLAAGVILSAVVLIVTRREGAR